MHQLNGIDVHQLRSYVAAIAQDPTAADRDPMVVARWVGAGRAEVTSPSVVMCGHGERAMTGASLLERSGSRPAVFLGGPVEMARARGEQLVGGT